MHAAYITAPGPAEAITWGELPTPCYGPTDVLVRVRAVAANPVDTFVRSGAYPVPMPLPFVIGRDLVGEVVSVVGGEVGGEVADTGATGFAPGRRVWTNSLGHGGRQGSFAEYATVPADRLYPAPADLDPLDLVAAAHPAATAWLALIRHGHLRPGHRVHIGGATGNVGSAAVALAAAAGATVVATAHPRDHDHVHALGAADVLDYRTDHPDARDFDLYVDTSGHGDPATALDRLAPRGRLVVMAGLHRTPAFPLGHLYTKDATIAGFAISNATVPELAEAASGVVHLLRTTAWRPHIAARLPLSRAAEAHRMLEAGEVRGRVVLDVADGGEGTDTEKTCA
ncbi:alcohol dehydrogenase catalytic domain-containing protein [Nonomuraea sp. SBT364]|uniref:alcohol dehydrogenase catalytic domain-containing protein n=1 Tax=Nonomuraea sp. SBT364 TaxID=1580530 RepID=UPI00066EF875|nr:zinc-binding dehydrogenase [Nonomuraea sp. SBT364]